MVWLYSHWGSQMPAFSASCRLLAFGFCPTGSSGRDDKAELRQSFMKSNLLKAGRKVACLRWQCFLRFLFTSSPTLSQLFLCFSVRLKMRLGINWPQRWAFALWMQEHLLLLKLGFTASFFYSSSYLHFMLYSIFHHWRQCHNLRSQQGPGKGPMSDWNGLGVKQEEAVQTGKKKVSREAGDFLYRRNSGSPNWANVPM